MIRHSCTAEPVEEATSQPDAGPFQGVDLGSEESFWDELKSGVRRFGP